MAYSRVAMNEYRHTSPILETRPGPEQSGGKQIVKLALIRVLRAIWDCDRLEDLWPVDVYKKLGVGQIRD